MSMVPRPTETQLYLIELLTEDKSQRKQVIHENLLKFIKEVDSDDENDEECQMTGPYMCNYEYFKLTRKLRSTLRYYDNR